MRTAALLSVLFLAAPSFAQEAAAPRLTKAPKLSRFVEADYPPSRKAAGEQASVLLEIEIGADGKVESVKVAEPAAPDFDAAALAAARQFLFEPAEVDGVPAPVKITYRYAFIVKTETVQLGPQVNLEGVVLERYKKKPLAGVSVAIVDQKRATTTDEQGHFEFLDVPPGMHRLELSNPRLVTVGTDEEIVAGKKKTVRYFAELREEGIDEEKVVRAPRIRKEAVETSIRTEEARRVPGTQGDTLKVVQNLPGVARSSFGAGQLVVWGSAPRDTRVVVDGVEIPALYHVGGLRSTVNSDLVSSIDLAPGAYGAAYGRGMGGLVRIETRQLPDQGLHGYVAADALDGSAMLSGKAGGVKVAVAGRLSWLDRLLPLVTSSDIGDYFPIPRYWDAQAKASWDPGKDEHLDGTVLTSFDRLQRTIPSQDPLRRRTETTEASFWRASVRYARILPDGASLSVTPFAGMDRDLTESRFGAVPTRSEVTAWKLGIRSSYRRRLNPQVTLSLGLDALSTPSSVSRVGSFNLPPREGDIFVFGQPPGDDVSADSWTTHVADLAPYVFAEIALGPVTITPGLRADANLIEGSRLSPKVGLTPVLGFSNLTFSADPRITASWRVTPRLALNASAGLYHQAPQAEELSAVFGNPTLETQRALHLSVGASFRITPTLTLDTVGFFKRFDDLVVRSALPTPTRARALAQEGTGLSYGGQLLLRQELLANFFGWITYAISRSERTDHPGTAARLFDYDQTHVLGLIASYDFRGTTFGARFRASTGVPRTAVTGSFYDARDDIFQPLFGAHNGIRIPGFYQLDFRVERGFTLGKSKLNVFLDVQNVSNRSNAEEIAYSFDYSARKYVTGLPALAVLGARLEF